VQWEFVSHGFSSDRGRIEVLRNLSYAIPAGASVSVMGPSGAGKSTLLALVGGLERPDQGEVRVGGTPLAAQSRNDLAAYRCTTVGFVFQHFGLLDTLTAIENVALARTLAGGSARDAKRRAAELLEQVGMGDRSGHLPSQLSGGERQRVAVARAIANDPQLILADEPTGNLDEANAELVVNLLESLHAHLGCTVIMVTHDPALAGRAEVPLRLHDGQLVPMREPGISTPARARSGAP